MEAATFEHSDRSFVLVAVRTLFRNKGVFVWTLLSCLALIAAITVVTKRQYRSEMKFIVHSTRSNAVISPDHATNSVLMVVSEEELNSELEILQSEDVLSKVADPSWDPQAPSRSSRQLKEHSKRLAYFTKHLTVDPIRKADVISLSYVARTPKDARDTLALLASTYLAQHERLQRPSGTSNFFEEEASRYEREWKRSIDELVGFQQLHHLVSVADVEEKLQKAIADEEDLLRKNEAKLGESTARQEEAIKILKEVPARQQSQQRTLPSQLLIQQLRSQLMSLTNHRTELLTRYAPSDRLVVEVNQQIIDTDRAIEGAVTESSVENTTDINPPWQQLKTSLVQGRVERVGLLRTESGARSVLAALRSRLSEVQSLSPNFEELRSRSEHAQANFETFAEKRDRARVEDEMDARKLLNVTIMENPTLSYRAARPRPLLNLALGVPTALFFAVAVLYLMEAGRTTFAAPYELEEAIQGFVVATIPFESESTFFSAPDSLATAVVSSMHARTGVQSSMGDR